MKTKRLTQFVGGAAIIVALSVPASLFAQGIRDMSHISGKGETVSETREHRFKTNSSTLKINLSPVEVEGYDGDEVVISTSINVRPASTNPRAVGLKRLNSSGMEDNSGIGIRVIDEDSVVTLARVHEHGSSKVHMKVPRHMNVEITNRQVYQRVDVSVQRMRGEVSVTQMNGNVLLEEVTGPLTVAAGAGNVEVVFASPLKGPVSIIANSGFIDVSVPADTKAEISLTTIAGEAFADESLNLELQSTDQPQAMSRALYTGRFTIGQGSQTGGKLDSTRTIVQTRPIFGGVRLKGHLNGGGEKMMLNTFQGEIFLRKAD